MNDRRPVGLWYKSNVDLLTVTVTAVESAGEPYTLVTLVGEADVTNCDQLRERLEKAAARKPRTLIIDLAGLEFLDSSALHVLFRVNRTMDRQGGVLALAAARGPVAKILQRTATDQLIPVYPTVAAASAG